MRQLPPNPSASSENVRKVMRANRARDTGPELELRRALCRSGIVGYRVNLKGIPGRPDIAFTRAKVAVFVHGCFWHHCPQCNRHLPKSHSTFWRRKFQLNRERDRRKRRMLVGLGWTVLEIWECAIRKDLPGCVRDVARALRATGLYGVPRSLGRVAMVAERPTRSRRFVLSGGLR
jgi:DNA mismatch endonuclease, patch repair protein